MKLKKSDLKNVEDQIHDQSEIDYQLYWLSKTQARGQISDPVGDRVWRQLERHIRDLIDKQIYSQL